MALSSRTTDLNPETLIRDRIQPYPDNRFYWQYRGEPVLLAGASVEDNLFQIPDIEEHLDLLASVGGNYVRCTMSSRDEDNVWPFERVGDKGKYDLNHPGKEYWTRFERFLNLTYERDIILQIELWDRFDFSLLPWNDNPYNPANNVNYTVEESGLKTEYFTHAGDCENGFFRTEPALENNQTVLKYQQLQVDKMLSLTLKYPNILYCMDNETEESPEWGKYWAEYTTGKATESNTVVEATEMWCEYQLISEIHARTYDHPETYSFVDVSQNTHLYEEEHWNNALALREHIKITGQIRPMNNVKIYGGPSTAWGSTRDAQERFWRNVFVGLASSRFHRPGGGMGLNEVAQANITALRMLESKFNFFNSEPSNGLLTKRSWNGTYCTSNPGVQYAVFFTDGGNVVVDLHSAASETITLEWLDIRSGKWLGPPTTETMIPSEAMDHPTTRAKARGKGPFLPLQSPRDEGYFVALKNV